MKKKEKENEKKKKKREGTVLIIFVLATIRWQYHSQVLVLVLVMFILATIQLHCNSQALKPVLVILLLATVRWRYHSSLYSSCSISTKVSKNRLLRILLAPTSLPSMLPTFSTPVITFGAHERSWKSLNLAQTSEIGASMSFDWLVDGTDTSFLPN